MTMTDHQRRLHLVHTEASQGWGGQEIRILTEAQGMLERGHEVTLLTPPTARIFTAARDLGIPVLAMPLEKKRLPGALVMRRWLAHNPVDVINTHSSTDSWLVAVAQLAASRRPPVVRTRHISAQVKNKWSNRWLYGRASRRIVTTGERLRRTLVDQLSLPAEHVVSIPTGIDLQRFSPESARPREQVRAALGIARDARVIGIAATLRSWKGHDYLLEAFAQLAEALTDVELLIVGDGPRRELIRAWVAQSRCAGRIRLLGQRDDIPDLLAAMDVFALPSYANEGVPQAIMQAMAMHLPVVSTTVGSIDEAVENGVTGFQVEPRNTVQLTEKLLRLLEDAELRRRMGSAARARAAQRFGKQVMLDAMEQVFYQVVSS